MVYRNFNVSIIIRLLLIIGTSIWFALEIDEPQKAYTKFFIVLLIIIQSAFLIRYFKNINKEIIRFLKLMKTDDASYRFSSNLKGNFTELAKILNNTADLIENIKIEKEKQYYFLQFVIEQINIGLIAYNNSGEVQFTNNAFSDLLKIKWLKRLPDLAELDKQFYKLVQESKPEDLYQYKLTIDGTLQQLLIQKKQFKFNKEVINLVSIQNISAELDKKELDSWQRLIRVLTHEIMNSIAPITNLTYSIRRSLNENIDLNPSQKEIIEDAIEDTHIIEKRSNSLMQFVENYRKLTKIGKVNFRKVNVNKIIKNTLDLFKEDFKKCNIQTKIDINKDIEIHGDEKLLEQAFINIIKNAIDALKECNKPKISIISLYAGHKLVLTIKDNGKGIEEEKLDDIFIPFYTSKENGSGIGLSLVKQIVNLHKGVITVNSKIGEGTSFEIML